MSKKPVVDLENYRCDEQLALMKTIAESGECPFCMENFGQHQVDETLFDGTYWLLTYNRWPYKNTKVHLLAIYKEHAEDLHEVEPAAGQELIEIFQWAAAHFQVPGGGFVMRFGDTNFSAGSVQHLHAQFIQPDIEAKQYAPVRVKLGKSPSSVLNILNAEES